MTNHETDRRTQIRRVLAEADGFGFASLEPHDYQRHADAILALFEPDLLRAQAEAHQYRTALEGVARKAAVSVPPPAPRADDQTALRDRIAEALRPGSRDRSGQYPEGLMRDVDAVLAVLPAPADRAAVCICGHTEQQHFEDACVTEVTGCDCGDFLTGEAAREVIARWRYAAIQARADRGAVLREAETEAERQLATVQRVRHVLELEPVLNRTALEYRGLIITALMADEAQPTTTPEPAAKPPVGYSGKGRVWCVACPRPDGEDVPVTVDVLQPYEQCAGCGRDVVDVARAAGDPRPVGPCVAGEQQNETPEAAPESCTHCGKTIRLITGTLAEWWVHDPGGNTICVPEQAASSPRATPKPAAAEPPRVIQCTRAILSRPHEPHGWSPRPGMDPVDCPGHSFTEAPE